MTVGRFAAYLWDPTDCNVCMSHYRIGFEAKDVEVQEKNKAANSLKKWLYGFRKGAQKGPFILYESWRQRVVPETDKRFVFCESLHGSGGQVEQLVDIDSAAATVDSSAPSTSGLGQVRTAGEWKMSVLNLDVEPMEEEGEDVALQGGDDGSSQVSEGTERDLMRNAPVSSELLSVYDSIMATTSVITDVVSPPVCPGGAPRAEVTMTVSSITTPISSATTSNAGGALPSRDVPQDPPQGPVGPQPEEGVAPHPVVDPNMDLHTLIATLIQNTNTLQKGMDIMGGWMQNSLTEVRSEVATLSSQMRQEIDSVADVAQRPALPPLSECPPTTEDNPWKMGLTFSTSAEGNLLSIGTFDVRPLECFELFPKNRFPTCWVSRRPLCKT